MNEKATATRARQRPDRHFAGGLPWEPTPGPGEFASSAPIVLPDRARPRQRPSPSPGELEALGRRTASVAHDFNNLLSVIMVCANEIATGAEGAQRERAEEISEAAKRGAELSRGLLAEERAFTDAAPRTTPEALAVEEAILSSRKLIERALGPDIELGFSSEAALPRAVFAAADLERVLLNLAANARDAMPAGGVVVIGTGVVSVPPGDSCLGTGWHVQVSFGDTGTGMSPGVARRALEPYFSTKGGRDGRGLGLASAHAMLREAGGDLRIDSRPGAGTTVSIYLPAVDLTGEPLALPAAGA